MKGIRIALMILAVMVLGLPAAEQTTAQARLLQAKAAYNEGNRVKAEALFLQVIELDPDQSAAYYFLGLLAKSPAGALPRFREYTALEPGDAWGWLALGNTWLKLGRTVEALRAYERAAQTAQEAEDIKQALAKGKLRAAPTLQPLGGTSVDSDGTHVARAGLAGDMAFRGGFRLGGLAIASWLDDGTQTQAGRTSIEELLLRLEGRPSPVVRLEAGLGAARHAGDGKKSGSASWTTPEAEVRVRWRAPDEGLALDIRAQRKPLIANPLLALNKAVSNEARLGLDVPAGPFRIRGTGRAGWIEARGEKANRRLQSGIALVRPLGASGEVSLQAHWLGFARASSAGYFAPRAVETLEAGTAWEIGGNGPVAASLDLGAGIQRLAKAGEAFGLWKTALRGWGTISIELLPTLQWQLEAEAYSAPFAPVGAVTAPGWKYLSVSTGLKVRLR
ncbi:MAG: tetratricopeptide repeat protein [Candidatus Aminicenantes bacterium]|nr:tetratricopeptide repeat protein [Candidatus Aminicenantes bacterium]